MRPLLIPAVLTVLLTAACGNTGTSHPVAEPSHSTDASMSSAPSSSPRGHTGPIPAPSGTPRTVIVSAKLPFKPAAGMPALSDVKVTVASGDACSIPPDDSGDEAQLIGAVLGGPRTVNATFEFTNPCTTAVTYSYKITTALDGPHGAQAGGGAVGTTSSIKPGQSIKDILGVDVDYNLTAAQQKRLWLGCTQIGKDDS